MSQEISFQLQKNQTDRLLAGNQGFTQERRGVPCSFFQQTAQRPSATFHIVL